MARALATVALFIALNATGFAEFGVRGASSESRPNFILIVVDDLDSASVAHMPALNQHLVANGVTFSRFFATTPLCCPSRASILRGQYAHNHRVLRNTGDDAGFAAFHESGAETETIATTLDAAGYETALVGKYLNGYPIVSKDQTFIPPGWDFWVAGVNHAAYNGFNYDLNVNGELVHHGRNDRDYTTDVLTAHALAFLDRAADADQPFLLYLAPYAPHSPSTPAPRHKGQFRGASAPRSAAFNERNIQDKPDWVRTTARLSDEKISRIDSNYRRRLESLLAVDDMVDAVMRRIAEQEALESTYVFFLSDNGYFLGEHRQPHGKDAPYDAASRIPLIVRGPGVPPGSTVDGIALNIDIFPTLVDLIGMAAPSFVDGRSVEPLLSGANRGWRTTALIEGFGKETETNEGEETSTPPFRALRTESTLYVEYGTGERELYDLRKDPLQLSNIAHGTSKTFLREFSRRLEELASCAGRDCQALENEPQPRWANRVKNASPADRQRRDRDHRGPAPTQRDPRSDKAVVDRRAAVGGEEDAVAMLQFSIDRRVDLADDRQLRLHISSLESSGTLVATLKNGPIAIGGVPARQRQRLAGRHVDRRGWVRLDISDALGNSGDLTVGLRGRDGASLSVSMIGSANPPELKEGHGESSTVRRDDRKPREHQNRDRHRERDETPRAQRQRGR